MAFPTSPANNQTALVNGIVYQWNNTLGAWKRNGSVTSISVGQVLLTSAQTSITNGSGSLIVSGGAGISGNIYSGGIYITGSANGITFSDSTFQNTAFTGTATDTTARTTANSASSYANGAFVAANTADQRAVTSGSYANSAYTSANTADQRAVTSGAYANSAFGVANSASSYANGAFAAANTADQRAVTSGSYANSAFGVANSASSYANGAFATANTADQRAVTSGAYANAAFGVANSASSYANGAFAAANSKFNSSGGTISGDTTITGNLTVSGATTYANTTTVNLGDNIITLNADLPQASQPSENAGIEIDRGAQPNSQFLWIESAGKWSANNGNTLFYIASESAESYANGAFAAANTADQKGVSAGSYANAAFGVANSASSYANGAFAAANTADQKGVSAGSYANSAYQTSNSSSSYANGAFAAANTADQKAVTSGSYANSAYLQANAVFTQSNTYVWPTANSASSYANGAFAAANIADQRAVTSGSYANSAYVHANAAFNQANTGSADTFARTQANAAFAAANTATSTVGQLAYNHANGAYSLANTLANTGTSQTYIASLQNFTSNGQNTTFTLSTTPTSANQLFVYVDGIYQQASAYTLSNNIITLSEALDANAVLEVRVFANTTTAHINNQVDTFTGTGACTTFTLTSVPRDKNLTTIIVGGVPQLKSAYNISGSSLVFSGAPANGASIEVSTYSGGGSYATSFTSVIDTFAGDNSTTTFTLSTLPQSENQTFAFLNGVYQQKNTYSLSGANIVFTGTATTNDTIEVVTVAGSEMNVTSARYNTRAYTANGVQTTFTISSGHTANSILVFENGICQEPIADYTVSGTTLTFLGGAPVVNTRIQIRELPV